VNDQSTVSTEILFEEGILGVPRARRFQLMEQPGSPVMVLKCLDISDFLLPVVDPALAEPDYVKTVAPRIHSPVEFQEDDPVLLLAVAALEKAGPVANLRAPVILNVRTMRAGPGNPG